MTVRPTEALHPVAAGIQRAAPDAVLAALLEAQVAAAQAVRPALPALARAADLCSAAIEGGHRLVYAGAGSSGLMALSDCLELAGTFGIAPAQTAILFPGGAAALLHMTGAPEDDPRLAASDLAPLALGPGDVVIAVSASGSTPYTLEIARLARGCGAAIIGLANVADSPLLLAADLPVLLDTGPEPIAGSTRMGAGTAQKIALNMLSTLTGLKLGHVHEGYMINLVADNEKLAARAVRMVAALAGTDTERAADALSRVSGAVKPAILVAAGATPEAARAILQTHRGHLGPALAEVTG